MRSCVDFIHIGRSDLIIFIDFTYMTRSDLINNHALIFHTMIVTVKFFEELLAFLNPSRSSSQKFYSNNLSTKSIRDKFTYQSCFLARSKKKQLLSVYIVTISLYNKKIVGDIARGPLMLNPIKPEFFGKYH